MPTPAAKLPDAPADIAQPQTPSIPYGQKIPAHEAVIHVMAEHGVDTIFGYPGGAIMPIYDGLAKVKGAVHHILHTNEGSAGHAAQGYARSTGKTGVVFVTSGPGLTNAVTPMADAQGDSIPVVFISGQVPTSLIGTDAFQEVDATGITRSVTKFNKLVRDAEDLIPTLREAFAVAATGRPGPVHIDIPKDVQNATVMMSRPAPEHTARAKFKAAMPSVADLMPKIQEAAWLMAKAQRPVLYVGGGVINSGAAASNALQRLMQTTGFPATSTLMGLGAYPTDHPHHLGMLGMHGTYEANMAMHGADMIVAIGARFDDRVTGDLKSFAPHARIIHIDIDKAELGKLVKPTIGLQGDVGTILPVLNHAFFKLDLGGDQYPALSTWWDQINAWRTVKCLDFDESKDFIRPQHALRELAGHLEQLDDYIVATNVGKHQMWVPQYLPFKKPRQLLTSGKVGTMGYGLPAGIGAQWGNKDVPVVVVTGDGSWRMNTPEVETACRKGLPVKVMLLNDHRLGMVDQWQELFHGGRNSEVEFFGSTKDFVGEFKAQGHNAWGERITHPSQLAAAVKRMMDCPHPYLLEIDVSLEKCFPMMPAGAAHNEMALSPEAAARAASLRPKMA